MLLSVLRAHNDAQETLVNSKPDALLQKQSNQHTEETAPAQKHRLQSGLTWLLEGCCNVQLQQVQLNSLQCLLPCFYARLAGSCILCRLVLSNMCGGG